MLKLYILLLYLKYLHKMERKNTKNNSSFLKMVDIFESPITLSYNKRYLYETDLGGVLTIITFLIIFIYSIYNLADLIQGKNYTLISNESIDYKYKLDFSNVPFGFKLINSKGEDFPLDPSIYNYKIITTEYYFIQNSDEKIINYIEEDIEFDYCEKFIGKNEFYNLLGISNLICIKPGQNLTMYGKFGDANGFKGFRIYINRCNIKSENNTCLDNEIVNKKLANMKFIFFYLGYEINHYSNDKNVVHYKLFNGENGLSVNFMKKYYYKFQKAKYNLYNNIFLFTYKDSLNFYITDGYEFDFELDSSNSLAESDNSLGYFAFNTNAIIIEYTKTLNSLWDIFSKIGGLFNIIVSISRMINSFVSKRILLLDINRHLINDYSPVINKIEIKDIKSIFNNLEKERIHKKDYIKNDNSSIGINNKNEKLFESKLRREVSNKDISQENVANVAYFPRKRKSRLKSFKTIKNINKQSILWFYICPFLILQKLPKLNYYAQLEQNFNDCFSIENFLKMLEINKTIIDKNVDHSINFVK